MRRQTIDCQWNLISPRTLRGLRNPDACAVLRFKMLIASAIADIAAQSDCRLERLHNQILLSRNSVTDRGPQIANLPGRRRKSAGTMNAQYTKILYFPMPSEAEPVVRGRYSTAVTVCSEPMSMTSR